MINLLTAIIRACDSFRFFLIESEFYNRYGMNYRIGRRVHKLYHLKGWPHGHNAKYIGQAMDIQWRFERTIFIQIPYSRKRRMK